ncbi:hypothetical protein ACOMHN_027492 [Nucella lapillus]
MATSSACAACRGWSPTATTCTTILSLAPAAGSSWIFHQGALLVFLAGTGRGGSAPSQPLTVLLTGGPAGLSPVAVNGHPPSLVMILASAFVDTAFGQDPPDTTPAFPEPESRPGGTCRQTRRNTAALATTTLIIRSSLHLSTLSGVLPLNREVEVGRCFRAAEEVQEVEEEDEERLM